MKSTKAARPRCNDNRAMWSPDQEKYITLACAILGAAFGLMLGLGL